MLEHYTFQKLLEYDHADRKNKIIIRREQEKMIVYQLAKEKKRPKKDLGTIASYSAKPIGAKYTERNPG
ncbi:hypothetical protein [Paenibacillus sp.]|jgi:hypothetical protein|uniref:hypothetical protein n=1 Tax=Paenibacillus sp. TaxID=58172 RepID=UPI00283A8E34|nr:hypothetical protein [Paenibacillus sp.]